MKYLIPAVLFLALSTLSQAQTTVEYPHCKCTEIINYSPSDSKLRQGTYKMTCNGVTVEEGSYTDGLKDGLWTSYNKKGIVIAKIDYADGQPNGAYLLFYYTGKVKLKAQFATGTPTGTWQYFNQKEKIIKTGEYHDGKPVGVWTIFDKSGKKSIAQYDFDSGGPFPVDADAYYKPNSIHQDNKSGEYFIDHYPSRFPKSTASPLGGFLLAGDFFTDLMSIPDVMMDTYAHYEFTANVNLERNSVIDISVTDVYKRHFDPNAPALTFIVETNPPAKLKRVEHNADNINDLKDKIRETIILLGPWTNMTDSDVAIQIPFVLNDIRR